jgi:thiamine biosynthesis lipoprotein
MSEWREDSPLAIVNQNAGKTVAVPRELVEIIQRAIDYGHLTRGTFDITWRGMGDLWSFDESFRPPSPDRIAQALDKVGFERIVVDGTRVGLSDPEMAIGLGGIAKGYAIDRAAQVLRERGFANFLLNGGGDIFAAGRRGNREWMVGVRDPRGGPADIVARVRLEGAAIVTSGDYERYTVVDGVRYHHIMDPRTGRPARLCRSVTIVAQTVEEADVLATALFVLGPVDGLSLASSRPGLQAFIIDAAGEYWMTGGFEDMASPLSSCPPGRY